MKIVNKHGLPEEIMEFLTFDRYDYDSNPNTISATTIIKPTQEVILSERYGKDIEIDAMSRLWAVLGTAVHKVLEAIPRKDADQETRLKYNIDEFTITGKPDLIRDEQVKDYKVTSAFKIIFKSYDDWIAQMSIYRWLYLKLNGVLLNDKGRIIYLLRDWNKKDLKLAQKRMWDYPIHPMWYVDLDLWSEEETFNFLQNKVNWLRQYRKLSDDELPPCNDTERWRNKKTGTYNKCQLYCNAYNKCKQGQCIK